MSLQKPHRIRVRVLDGKPREWNKLKGQLGSHFDVFNAKDNVEFVIGAVKEAHIEQVRAKLGAAGLGEIAGGDTNIAASTPERVATEPRQQRDNQQNRRGPQQSLHRERGSGQTGLPSTQPLPGKPYGFVPLPEKLTSAAPVWHDGTSANGRLSGEIRCELETLTPLLVGWERRQIGDSDESWRVPHRTVSDNASQAFVQEAARQVFPDPNDESPENREKKQKRAEENRKNYVQGIQGRIVDVGVVDPTWTIDSKSILCPLRASWEHRPVILLGDSLKGLLRHELGALLGAPMERVAERSYSYRPNLKYPNDPGGRFLEPRLARVAATRTIDAIDEHWSFPERIDVLSMATRSDQRYYPRRERDTETNRSTIVNPVPGSEPYKGGLGGGRRLPDEVLSADARRSVIHTHIDVRAIFVEHASVWVSDVIAEQYARTLIHLLDSDDGHFGARHPNIGTNKETQRKATDAVSAAAHAAFQPGDLIWIEWDTEKRAIVSLGWHYYYRWAYTDTVHHKEGNLERHGLFPLPEERSTDGDGAPEQLSAVRRLFGYTGDNEGSQAIGRNDYSQLMGRLSVNAALEVIAEGDTHEKRFLPPTFLKELGMPRPSAVEHYIKQPYYPRNRPSDKAVLATYGDAAGYDAPGELAGRKFYLDRKDAYKGEPWKDDRASNRLNDRSTLALEASREGRRFRFTVRFRDLEPVELAAVITALCPNQFRALLGGKHEDGYCSKLGYARPLGWGSVRIQVKALLFLDLTNAEPALTAVPDVSAWLEERHQPPSMLSTWLAIHRHKHPDASDYPSTRDGQIYTFHTSLRSEHSRLRRYRSGGS